MSFALPARTHDTTPSTRLVYVTLAIDGPLSYDELKERTGLGRKTARRAIQQLSETGVIESNPDPRNPPQKLHDLDPDAPSVFEYGHGRDENNHPPAADS